MKDADSVGGESAASRRGPAGVSGTMIAGRFLGGGVSGRGGRRFAATFSFGAGFFLLEGRRFAGAGFLAPALRAAGFLFDAAFLRAAFLFAAMFSAPPRMTREK